MTQYCTMEYLNNAELNVQLPMFNYICHCTEKKSVAGLRFLHCVFHHSKTEKAVKLFSGLFCPSGLPSFGYLPSTTRSPHISIFSLSSQS